MALVDMVMPQMGESIMECTVITWLKKPGDRVEADESILEVATDKVDTEVPAAFSGILKEVLFTDGDVIAIGATIARIETSDEEVSDVPANQPAPAQPEAEPSAEAAAQDLEASILAMSTRPAPAAASPLADSPVFANRFYSPLVQNIARQEGISREELDRVPGTGAEGRVTKQDMLDYVQNRQPVQAPATPVAAPAPAPAPAPVQPPKVHTTSLSGQSDIIQMDRMRKMIAQRMVESKQISPHVSSFVEADMTPVVQWRNKVKDVFRKQTGEGLTYTPILIEAIVKAIKDFPMINISVDGDNIIVQKGDQCRDGGCFAKR